MNKEKIEKINGIINMQTAKAHESCTRVSKDVGREYHRNDEERIIEEIFRIVEQRGRIEPYELKRHIRSKISDGVNYIIQNAEKIEARDSEIVETIVATRLSELARDIQSGKEVDLELEARKFAITRSTLGDLQEQMEKGVRRTDYKGNEVNSGNGANDAKREIFSAFSRVSMDLAKCGIRLSSAEERRIEGVLDDFATKIGELTFQSRNQKISLMENIVKEVPGLVNSELGKIKEEASPEETSVEEQDAKKVITKGETLEAVILDEPVAKEKISDTIEPEEVMQEELKPEEPIRLEDMPGYVDPEKAAHEAFEETLRRSLEEMGEWPPKVPEPEQEGLVLETINVQENDVSRSTPKAFSDVEKTTRRVDYEEKIKDIRSDTRINEAKLDDTVKERVSRLRKQIMSVVGDLITPRRNGLGGRIQRQVREAEEQIAEACARLENQVKNTSRGYSQSLSTRTVKGVNEIEQNSEDTSQMSDELKQDERKKIFRKTRTGVEETSQEAQDRKSRSSFVEDFTVATEQITKAINQYVSSIGVVNLNIRPGELERLSRDFHQVMQGSVDDVVNIHNNGMKTLTKKLQERITELERDINRSEGIVEQEDDKRGIFSVRDIGDGTIEAQGNTQAKRKEESVREEVKKHKLLELDANLII